MVLPIMNYNQNTNPGDLNMDMVVNFDDFNIMINNWLSTYNGTFINFDTFNLIINN